MTKKKIYEKPSMQVFELKQQPQLLAGSDVSATMDGTFTEDAAARELFGEFDDLSTLMGK